MSNTAKHYALFGLSVFFGFVVFRHAWMWSPNHTYRKLSSDPAVLRAFSSGDSQQIAHLQHTYGLDYQEYSNGRLQQQSSKTLPYLRIITQQQPAAGVIAAPLADNLAAMRPYIIRNGIHRSVLFIINGPSGKSFAVYKQVAL